MPKSDETNTSEKKSPKKQGYIEIPLPQITFGKISGVNVILVALLLIFAFIMGIMYNKLQGGGSSAPTNINEALISYAKKTKLKTKQFSQCLESRKYKDVVEKDAADAQKAGASGTPATYVNGILVSGAQPFDIFQSVIEQELKGGGGTQSRGLFPKAYAQEATDPNFDPTQIDPSIFPTPTLPPKVVVAKGHLPFRGNEKAKVTVVEFSDFQCPFCKSFFDNALQEVKKQYIDTGKIAFFYRHYPLTQIHPNAQIAAEASECANEQGKFWEYHDLLFQNQDAWSNLLTAPVQ
ncbi:MAG TPA: thioredoxin domain-containing protein [Patescibacteria group bacterium]|nr:thioredoxin domain-containing protein [Patescibacteria group bacterium]